MGEIVSRVKALELPLDKLVVIGSGLLDAYGIRESSDIDLAVSEELFAQMKEDPRYELQTRHGEEMLEGGNVEAWRDWFVSYDELVEQAVTIDGVRFAAASIIMEHKRLRGSEKDLKDIRLLQEYLNEQ